MAEARAAPPRWLNTLMAGMLRTPGLQRLVGKGTALLSFTGRRSGTEYTTPISYAWSGDRVLMIAHVSRQWWRNLADNPGVRLRLAGKDVAGTATVLEGDTAREALTEFFADQTTLARASGVGKGPDGRPDPAAVEAQLASTVVVSVDLAGTGY
jgi:deazaflavin-dependent oxidoreductase (nitroreductase family)